MKKIKVGLIELKDHPVFLDSLVNVFGSEKYDISVYLSNYFKSNLVNKKIFDIENIDFNIQKKNEKLLDFINRNKKDIENNDIIIFLTPKLEILYNITFKSPVLLNIHNLNTWLHVNEFNFFDVFKNISPEIRILTLPKFVYKFKLTNKLFKTIKILKYFFLEYFNKKKRKKIFNKIDAINLLHPNMNNIVKKQFNKKIVNLPFRFPLERSNTIEQINNDYLCIGIMGTIDQQRRDYLGLLNYLADNNNQIDYKIKFIFLGTFTGEKKYKDIVLELIKRIKNDNIDFELFLQDDFIEQNLFDKKMKDIDIILAPINRYKYNSLYKEEYGVTKATGSDFDAFFYNKPIIMPGFYTSISYLENFYDFYDDYNNLLNLFRYYSSKSNLIDKYEQLNINCFNLRKKYLKSIKKISNV